MKQLFGWLYQRRILQAISFRPKIKFTGFHSSFLLARFSTMTLTCFPRIAFVPLSDWLIIFCFVYSIDGFAFTRALYKFNLLACRLVVFENIVQTSYTIYSEPIVPQGFSLYRCPFQLCGVTR